MKGRGGLGRVSAWRLPGGPVGPASRWTVTSNVEVGQTTFPVNRGKVGGRGEKGARDKVTKRRRGEGRTEWTGRRAYREFVVTPLLMWPF